LLGVFASEGHSASHQLIVLRMIEYQFAKAWFRKISKR